MYKFGEIYMAALPVAINSNIQQGTRPVIIVSNDKNNCFSTVVNVIPLTSSTTKHNLPVHVQLEGYGLIKPSIALCEQITTIDMYRLDRKIGCVDDNKKLRQLQKAMMIQFNMAA